MSKSKKAAKHTMLSEIWRRFRKNRQAVVGLVVLVLFVLIAIFADAIAPYGFDDQDASRAQIAPVSYTHLVQDRLHPPRPKVHIKSI